MGHIMALEAIILTCDGTLAETADVRRSAFNQAFAEAGLNWVWGRAMFAQILSSAQVGRELEFYIRMRNPYRANYMDESGLLEHIERRQNRIYLNMLEAGAASLRPGIARVMAEVIASNVKLFVCSCGARDAFETLLFNQFGLEMIEAITGSIAVEDMAGGTPVTMLRHAKHTLQTLPQDTLAICSQPQEAAAAASLGMTVIATPTFYSGHHKFSGAHVVLSDLGHPAAPFSVLSGNAYGDTYATLSTLEFWHAKYRGLTARAA